MTRAEQRRIDKSKAKKATYNYNEEQIEAMFRERMDKEFEIIKQDAVAEMLGVVLALPMDVLMEDFWPKTYPKKIPQFTKKLLEKFEKYQNGELDMKELQEKLWTYAGVRLLVREDNADG